MSGRRRPKDLTANAWASANHDRKEKQVVITGRSFLMHERVLELTPGAYRVYSYMMLSCRGAQEFEMPQHEYLKFTTKPSFLRAVRELSAAGFIEVIKTSYEPGKPIRYRFNYRWKVTS